MKKRVFLLLLCLALVVCMLASCGNNEDPAGTSASTNPPSGEKGHVHTYSDSWSEDAEGHWYDATCECEDAPTNKLAHVDANNDGLCDLCSYTDHTHTYDTESWTVDCTNHWHAADCGHIVAGTDVAAHADANEDGRCDVCNYVIEEIHTHVFDDEWTADEKDHWHAALCEHKSEIADKAAHNVNAAGVCTVCDAQVKTIDKTNIEAVLQAAIANNYKVIDGDVLYSELVYDGVGADRVLENSGYNETLYVLGNGESYVFLKTLDENGNIESAEQYWAQQLGADEFFGVEMKNGSYELTPVSVGSDKLNGYTYIPGSLLIGTENNETLSQTIYEMYLLMNSERSSNKVVSALNGNYSFSYNYYYVNITKNDGVIENIQPTYFDVSVEFTVDENWVVNFAEITVESYRSVEFNDGTSDIDLDYNAADNTVTLRADADPTVYSYEVVQHSGERTFTNPYPKASLMPMDFELYDSDADWQADPNGGSAILVPTRMDLITGEVTIPTDKYIRFYLGDLKPITASIGFLNANDFKITFVNDDADSEGQLYTSDPYYSNTEGFIGFQSEDAGTYTMTITYGDIVKTIKITVEAPKPPEIEDTETAITVEVSETYAWDENGVYSYTANAAGTYTFTLPAGLGMWDKEGRDSGAFTAVPQVDLYNNTDGGATVDVALDAGETYEFYVSSTLAGFYTIEVSFEAGSGSGSGEGGNQGGGDEGGDVVAGALTAGNNIVVFTDGEITNGSAERTLTITTAGNYKFNGDIFVTGIVDGNGTPYERDSATYTYALAAGEYTVTFSTTFPMAFVAGENYSIVIEDPNAEQGGDQGGETDTIQNGTYAGTDDWDNEFLTVIVDGSTVTFEYNHPVMEPSSLVCTYTVNDGVVTLYNEDGSEVYPIQASLTVTGGVPTSASYNGTTYTLTASEGGNEGGDDPIVPDGPDDITTLNGDGTRDNPYVITEGGEYLLTDVNTFPGQFVTFTADVAMTVTLGTDCAKLYNTTYQLLADTAEGYIVELAAGESIIFKVTMGSGTSDVVLSVEVEEKFVLPEGVVDVTTLEGDGSYDTPWVITEEGTYYMEGVNGYPGQRISITATEDMCVILNADAAEIWDESINNRLAYVGQDYSANIEAGQTLVVTVCTETTETADVMLTVTHGIYIDPALVPVYSSFDYQTFEFDGYSLYFYQDWSTGAYVFEVNYPSYEYETFQYTLTANGDGSYTINAIPLSSDNSGLAEATIVATPNEFIPWVISVNGVNQNGDPLKDSITYNQHKFDEYIINFGQNAETGDYIVTVSDVDYSFEDVYSYELTANGDGSYTVTLTATANDTFGLVSKTIVIAPNEFIGWICSVDGVVQNGDPVKESLTNAGASYETDEYSVGFSKDYDTGSYYAIAQDFNWTVCNYFSYTVVENEDGTYTITLTYAPELAASWSPDTGVDTYSLNGKTLTAVYEDGEWTITLDSEGGESAGTGIVEGVYTGSNSWGNGTLTLTISGSTATFVTESMYGAPSTVSYDFTVAEGIVTLYNENDEPINALFGYITIDENGVPTAAGCGGTDYTFATTDGGDDGNGDEEEGEGDGSAYNPYTLNENNTCAFPGGMDYVFYSYTATEAGTLTVTMTSADFFWAYGTDPYALDIVGSSTASAQIPLAAGQTILIGISTNSTSAGDVTFTSSFQASGEVDGGDDGDDGDDSDDNQGGADISDATDIATVGGSGTGGDPYTVTEAGTYAIYNVTYSGTIVSITATEDITVTITADKAEIWSSSFGTLYAGANTEYTFTLAAGETKKFAIAMAEDGIVDNVVFTVVY